MNIADMRELPRDELISEISKVRGKIWKARFQAKGEPLENAGALRGLKKDVARLLTILRQKDLARETATEVTTKAAATAPAGGGSTATESGSGEQA